MYKSFSSYQFWLTNTQFTYVFKGFYGLGNGLWWFIRLWHSISSLIGIVHLIGLHIIGHIFIPDTSTNCWKWTSKSLGHVGGIAYSGSSYWAMCSWMLHSLAFHDIWFWNGIPGHFCSEYHKRWSSSLLNQLYFCRHFVMLPIMSMA